MLLNWARIIVANKFLEHITCSEMVYLLPVYTYVHVFQLGNCDVICYVYLNILCYSAMKLNNAQNILNRTTSCCQFSPFSIKIFAFIIEIGYADF